MFYFFDSSALAKLFHPELGSPAVTAIFSEQENEICVSRLAQIEITSVAAIKVRTGAMTPSEAVEFLADVEDTVESQRILVQPLVDQDYRRAQQLLSHHAQQNRLRTLDALHLASAIRRRAAFGVDFFVTADLHLARVAALEEFKTLIPG